MLLSSRPEFASSNWKKLAEMDLESAPFIQIAQKNAFSALSKRMFCKTPIFEFVVPAAIFFLLARDVVGSINICLEKLNSASLALLIATLSGFSNEKFTDGTFALSSLSPLDLALFHMRLGTVIFSDWISRLCPADLCSGQSIATLSNAGFLIYGLSSKSLLMSPDQRQAVLRSLWESRDFEMGQNLSNHWIWGTCEASI